MLLANRNRLKNREHRKDRIRRIIKQQKDRENTGKIALPFITLLATVIIIYFVIRYK